MNRRPSTPPPAINWAGDHSRRASNSNYIYAPVQSITQHSNGGCGSANGCQLGAYRTTDGGVSWSLVPGSLGNSLQNCTGGAGDYPQNWYDQGLAIDPNNPDRVFFDTFDVWFWAKETLNDTTAHSGGKIVHGTSRRWVRAGSSSVLLGE